VIEAAPDNEQMYAWMCSCGVAFFTRDRERWGGETPAIERHAREHSDHWPIREAAWEVRPCSHCGCFDDPTPFGHRPDASTTCCKCGQAYGPMIVVGGSRMLLTDVPDYIRALSQVDEEGASE
jgi:hypothetical protein